MRIIVTGREGQVARALAERGQSAGVEIIRLGRPHLDLIEPDQVARAILSAAGDVVVNAAAYTAVDAAEGEPELALQVNGEGARAVAVAAARTGRPVVQLSTDYVFDGALDRPYREDDPVGPVGVYGRTKLAGEVAVAAANPRHVIARTAWVYSPFGRNFVKTMLRLGETRDEVRVVADQSGAPTSALDIADALIAMARRLIAEPREASLYGIFHLTGAVYATWADFATEIFAQAAALGRHPVAVIPISTAQYPTPAARPANSRLDIAKLQRVYGLALPDWRDSARDCVKRLILTPEG